MPGGELVTCDSCQGWLPSETGTYCTMCDGSGQVWNEYPNEDDDYMPETCVTCGRDFLTGDFAPGKGGGEQCPFCAEGDVYLDQKYG